MRPLPRHATALLLLLLSCAASAQAEAPCTAPTVHTSGGDVCGLNVQAGASTVAAYLGIPYGEDTGGANRFAPPVPRSPWTGVLSATQPGNACPQVRFSTIESEPPASESEDCLVLNVWTPTRSQSPVPVLVFIHGGGFLVGTATDDLASDSVDWYTIDGRFLAADQNLVVVTLNYRLGAFGFLGGLPDISGNFGILDQQLALAWVQQNIAAFGGDPDNVTLVGESAGGSSVAVHAFATPSSANLFRRAVIESNPAGFGIYDPGAARGQAEHFLTATGCLLSFDRLACLRSKTLDELIEAQSLSVDLWTILDRGIYTIIPWLPVVDGSLVVRQPLLGALDGAFDKALLVGNNDDEAFSFLGQLVTDDVNPLLSGAVFEVLFGSDVWEIIERSYLAGTDDTSTAMLAGAGDYVFMCPAELAALAAPAGYHYRFSHVPQYVGGMTGGDTCTERVCHAVELPYVFGTGRYADGFSVADRGVSDTMMRLWGAFAHGQADGGEGFGDWPPAGSGGGPATTLVIANPPVVSDFPTERCHEWEQLYVEALGR